MDSPGRPPPEELPQKPFGIIQHLTLEQEVGYRTGFTEKEREFSAHTIQRQMEAASVAAASGRNPSAVEEEDEDDGETSVSRIT